MSGAEKIMANVARTVALLRASDNDSGHRVAIALEDWRAGAAFEAALGLAGGWHDLLTANARLAALGRLADCQSEPSARLTAEAIERAVARYAAATWLHDRRSGRRPVGINGAAYDFLSVAKKPLSAERIRKLLEDRNGLS